MRRSPQEVVDTIAYFLKEGKQGDEYKISELAKKTTLSYVTVAYYLDLIEHAQKNIPSIEVVEKTRNSFVQILKEMDLRLSNEESVLIYLFDKRAFGEESAVSIEHFSKDIASEMIGKSLLSTTTKKAFLTTNGIVAAASIAGARADKAISSKKRKEIETGEIIIGKIKWQTTPPKKEVLDETGSDVKIYAFNEILDNGFEKMAISEGSIIMTDQAAILLYGQLKELMDKWAKDGKEIIVST